VAPLYVFPNQDTTIVFTAQSTDSQPISFTATGLPTEYIFVDNGDGTASLTITGNASLEGSREYTITATSGVSSVDFTFVVITVVGEYRLFVGPNPFSESLSIKLQQDVPVGYTLQIYSLSGEKVFEARSESPEFTWSAVNQNNEKVASGAYIIYVSADGIEEKVKVFKLWVYVEYTNC